MDYEIEGGGGMPHKLSYNRFCVSVAAILNFDLDYVKNMVYCLGNGSILFFDHQNVGFASKIKCLCKLLAEISTILDFCGGHFEFCQ